MWLDVINCRMSLQTKNSRKWNERNLIFPRNCCLEISRQTWRDKVRLKQPYMPFWLFTKMFFRHWQMLEDNDNARPIEQEILKYWYTSSRSCESLSDSMNNFETQLFSNEILSGNALQHGILCLYIPSCRKQRYIPKSQWKLPRNETT